MRPRRLRTRRATRSGANLGLYSITFNNRLDEDLAALEAYREFRLEAEQKGFRHFLEVFDPNAPVGLDGADIGKFVNDSIARTLAGVAGRASRFFSRSSITAPRRWKNWSRTIRISSSASWAAAPGRPTTPSN